MRLSILMITLWSGTLFGNFDKLIQKIAKKEGVPHEALKAICQAESNLNPDAYVMHDGGENNAAMGLCQVLLSTAAELISVNQACYADLRMFADKKICNLMKPEVNLKVAAKVLKRNLKRYEGSLASAILAYNSGSLKTCKTGIVRNSSGKKLYKCEIGGPLNGRYLDRVLEFMRINLTNGR